MTRRTDRYSPDCTTLSDLLPALRWADPDQLGPLLNDPRLPDRWWVQTWLVDAAATVGVEAIAQRTATALRAHWPHLALDAAMPHLRYCPEGQQADLSQIVGEAVTGMSVADGDAVLRRLIHAQLRPFQQGGRNLSESTVGQAVTAVQDLDTLAKLLTRLPADTPGEIKNAAAAVSEWIQAHSAVGADLDTFSVDETESSCPVPAVTTILSSPLSAIGELVGTWDPRQLAVASARMFTTDRVPLEVLGERFGVTRERIRQVQNRLEKQFQDWLVTAPGDALHRHLLAIQDALGPVATEAELQGLHEENVSSVPGLDLPLWQLLACCLPERHWDAGWIVEGDLRERQERTRTMLLQRCSGEALPWADAVTLLEDAGIREANAQAWLEDLGGFRIIDNHLLNWGRSINERAEAILSLVGQPMSAVDLQARLDDRTALVSLRNQLQADARFMRCDRDLYGLRRWGGPEYLGIRDMIVRELEAAGGQAPADDIVKALCGQFDVSDKSVHAYLNGPGFERFQRGWVRVATPTVEDETDYQPRRDVAHTRRCFQTGQGIWCYRLDVNHDHLRGSGFPIPSGFAAHLGLTPGNKIELAHHAGAATVAWGNQPTFGSLRPLLEALGAVEGDHVFLAARDGQLKAQRIAQEPLAELSDTECALRLMALAGHVDETDMPSVIGRRIGLAQATSMDELYVHLRVRGDKDILMLLQSGRGDGEEQPGGFNHAALRPTQEPSPDAAERSTGSLGPDVDQAGTVHRDPTWDEEVIPLLDKDSEGQLVALAEALAARGKAAPVFGYELADGAWQADFAWDVEAVKIAVMPEPGASGASAVEAEQRDAAYREAGWTADTAARWLDRLDELVAVLPDALPQG